VIKNKLARQALKRDDLTGQIGQAETLSTQRICFIWIRSYFLAFRQDLQDLQDFFIVNPGMLLSTAGGLPAQ
jgi:hypothetical protein